MKNKRVLLIDPVYNNGTIPRNVPLSKIAAGLCACGVEVQVIGFLAPACEGKDLSFFEKAENDFIAKAKLLATYFDMVYITTGTGNELKPYPIFPRILKLAVAIKSVSKVTVTVGGALINLYKKVYNLNVEKMFCEFIDYFVVGNEYHNAMKIIVNGNFPQSVAPLWGIWSDSRYPNYKSVQYHVGCPFSCDFCFEGKIYDNNGSNDKLQDFLASIEPGENIIVEDSVFLSYTDFDDVMSSFSEKGIQFATYARISEIIKEPKKVEQLRKAGCQTVIVGIETLDNDLLKGHNKSLVSSETRLGLDILKDNNIDIQGCFMLGFPEDSLNNMERTIAFAIDEQLKGYRWHIYQPNYSNMHPNFYSLASSIQVRDHLFSQLNVPDSCLKEMILGLPEIAKLDEHFMIRGKNYLQPDIFANVGYEGRFSYKDIKILIDDMFPKEWILNEEVLYKYLFNAQV